MPHRARETEDRMRAGELFDLIRVSFGPAPQYGEGEYRYARVRDSGKVSITLYPDGLICVNVWIGINANRRLKLAYSTEMPQDREVGGEDWVAHVVAFCEWEARRK